MSAPDPYGAMRYALVSDEPLRPEVDEHRSSGESAGRADRGDEGRTDPGLEATRRRHTG
jgi:hypothetical protein